MGINNRQGFFFTSKPLAVGNSWQLTIDFKIHNSHDYCGEGFGIWFLDNSPYNALMNETSYSDVRTANSAVGLSGNYRGFGLYAKVNSTKRIDEDFYVMNSIQGPLNMRTFMEDAKFCKRRIQMDEVQRVVFEYDDGELSTIIQETNDRHYVCETRRIEN